MTMMGMLEILIVLHQIYSAFSSSEYVRLVDGTTPNQGRVEIYHNGQWGTVCDDNFFTLEARTVCRALGYSDGTPLKEAHFGKGTGPIFVDDLRCSSLASGKYSLQLGNTRCNFKGWGVSNCHHGEDAGVECEDFLLGEHVRLVSGNATYQGRVEIYHNGKWGTICDDSFGYDEARAVCRALGYSDGIPFGGAHFGAGTGPVFVDDLQCALLDSGKLTLQLGKTLCYFGGWGSSSCRHRHDVGVECKVCSTGRFGQSCISKCHCRSSSGCDPVTGVCNNQASGCLDGWTGRRCDQVTEEQKSNNVGYKVAVSFLTILLVISIVLNIYLCVKFRD